MESIITSDLVIDPKLIELSAAMDAVEGYSNAHGQMVALVADELGRAFELAVHDRLIMQHAALVHDIGMIPMNRDYLRETRVLTDEEKIDMHRHTVIGEQEAAKHGLARGVQLLVRWHHERWDGGGYPDGLAGDEIPLAARILRAADTYSAMTVDRPFRKAFHLDEVRKYVAEWAGIEFDPRVAKALISVDQFFETERAAAGPA